MTAARAGIPRAVLDTNVIYSRVLHELFGRLAREARVLDPVWSDELLAEAKRVLITGKPMPEPAAERWVGYLRDAFPRGRVDIADGSGDADLAALTSDPDDEHVCALALAAQADLLITFDHGYHHDGLLEHGIAVTHPDTFLVGVFDEQPRALRAILARQAARGGRTVAELLDAPAACKRAHARQHDLRLTGRCVPRPPRGARGRSRQSADSARGPLDGCQRAQRFFKLAL